MSSSGAVPDAAAQLSPEFAAAVNISEGAARPSVWQGYTWRDIVQIATHSCLHVVKAVL
jgi:hypothetical protein